jgi:hypothetical protein
MARCAVVLDPHAEEYARMAQRSTDWIEELAALVASCIEAHSPMGPMKWQYVEEDGLGELLVYPTPVELVGGEEDGAIVIAGFALDVHDLLAAFDQVTSLQWYAHGFGPYDRDGPHVSLEGMYQGHEVWLRVLAEPPEDEEPGLQLDTSTSS